ncbi:MAG: TIGR03643 family protein [Salinibacter sp.]
MGIQDDHDLSDEEVSHIIGMAWKDDVPFEAIEARYDLDEEAVVALMRSRLKRSSWELWRKRVSGRPTKHASRRSLTDSVSRRPPGARSPEPLDEAQGRRDVPDRSARADRTDSPGGSGEAPDRSDPEQDEQEPTGD